MVGSMSRVSESPVQTSDSASSENCSEDGSQEEDASESEYFETCSSPDSDWSYMSGVTQFVLHTISVQFQMPNPPKYGFASCAQVCLSCNICPVLDMGPQEIQQNVAAADEFLQDIEWDDEDMAQPMDADDLCWKEPRKGSARWFTTRKNQPVFNGMIQ